MEGAKGEKEGSTQEILHELITDLIFGLIFDFAGRLNKRPKLDMKKLLKRKGQSRIGLAFCDGERWAGNEPIFCLHYLPYRGCRRL